MKTWKSEKYCENRLLFMYQNGRKGAEYGQGNGDTNFNEFQHGKSVCRKNGPTGPGLRS